MQHVPPGLGARAPMPLHPAFYPPAGTSGLLPVSAAMGLHPVPVALSLNPSLIERESLMNADRDEDTRTPSPDQREINDCKRSILNHPLFPLLGLLFEKCESATAGPDDIQTSDGVNADLHSFLQHQDRLGKPLNTSQPQVDDLMVTAIQVMRIYLLELEKVQDLCKDFCNRYITSLKSKLQSDILLSDSDSEDPPTPNPPQLNRLLPGSGSGLGPGGLAGSNLPLASAGGTVYQMVPTTRGLVAQPVSQQQSSANSTPSTANRNRIPQGAAENTLPGFSVDDFDDGDSKRSSKRGVLPKQATQIMKSWLFQHIVHPYPNEDEKRSIAQQTNLTMLQVNNWFINARRRILHPMMEQTTGSDSRGGNSMRKQNKSSSARPVKRFWPETIANLQPQPEAVQAKLQQHSVNSRETEDGSPPPTRLRTDERRDSVSSSASVESLNIDTNKLDLKIENSHRPID